MCLCCKTNVNNYCITFGGLAFGQEFYHKPFCEADILKIEKTFIRRALLRPLDAKLLVSGSIFILLFLF